MRTSAFLMMGGEITGKKLRGGYNRKKAAP